MRGSAASSVVVMMRSVMRCVRSYSYSWRNNTLAYGRSVCNFNEGRVGAALANFAAWWMEGIAGGIYEGVGDPSAASSVVVMMRSVMRCVRSYSYSWRNNTLAYGNCAAVHPIAVPSTICKGVVAPTI
jgi:hypothetical protein